MRTFTILSLFLMLGVGAFAQTTTTKITLDKKVLLEVKPGVEDTTAFEIHLSKKQLAKAVTFSVSFEGSQSEWKRKVWLSSYADDQPKTYKMVKADGSLKIPAKDIRQFLKKAAPIKIWTIMDPPADIAARVRLRRFLVCKFIVD